VITGEENKIELTTRRVGNRELEKFPEKSEIWYLQLQRVGSKYTGRISVDGTHWTDIGTHVIVRKDGRLGLGAESKGGIESPVEFDDFVVQGAKAHE
jgi:hypothetical protein